MDSEYGALFPIYGIENDCILSKQGDYTVAFRVEKPEIFTLSAEEYEELHQAFGKAIRVLPAHSILHLQDWFLAEHYDPDFDKAESFHARASERFFNERPWLRQESYLFLTKKPKGRPDSSSAASSLLRRRLLPTDSLDGDLVSDFLEQTEQFRRILEDTGQFRLTRLGSEELWSNQSHAGLIERYWSLSRADRPVLKDINFRDGIKIGDHHCLLYTLGDAADLPSLCGPRVDYSRYSTERSPYSIGFASPLGAMLSCDHIYNQYIFIGETPVMMKGLEAKRLRLQSLANFSRENSISEQASNDFQNQSVAEQLLPVRAHFNVLAFTDRKEDLPELKNKVIGAMSQLEASPRLETVGAGQVWWAGIPGNEAEFPMNDTFITFAEQASCFFNIESNYRSSTSPWGIRLGDRLTGMPVHVDIDIEPQKMGLIGNFNTFILSGSGGGKSFFTGHLCRSYYEQGCHVVIVDVGHSYEILCAYLGGYYFTYTEKDPIRFNPFYIEPGETFDTEKKESLKSLLLALWKKSDEGHLRSEYVALSNALESYYTFLTGNPSVFPGFDSFYEFVSTDFIRQLERDKVKEKEFDIANFLYVVRPFYRGGEFDYLLNARENLDLLRERFIVFELDNIKDNVTLFTVVTMVVMQLFLSKMRKLKGVRKVIVIEEAWKAIANAGMAENIRYWGKTLRKFMGKLILVTQEIEDIISSPIIKHAIINNSDCKILLDQSKFMNKFDVLQELLGLSDKQKAEILSINKGHEPGPVFKDVWIGLGASHSRVYRLEVSEEEYYTYSSDQRDKVLVWDYIHQYGNVRQALTRLAEDKRAAKKANL